MSDLASLQTAIDTAAAKVVDLKKSGGEVDAIKAAVAELLAAKVRCLPIVETKLWTLQENHTVNFNSLVKP